MSKNDLWFGVLEAGEKSSPVVRSAKLSTENPETFYLFNLKRNSFLEYKRDIAEPKLRELNSDEEAIRKELKTAFNKAVKDFTPRGKAVSNIVEYPSKPEAPVEKKPALSDEQDFDDVDIDVDDFDDMAEA